MMHLRKTLSFIRAAYPGNDDVVRDVVHVEIWNYAMKRFAAGGSATDIFSEVNSELQTKDVKKLVSIIQRAREEWVNLIPGARVVKSWQNTERSR